MSTTTDMRVAVHYGLSAGSLLFLLKVDNFLQYGAELQWLSAFPGEAEVNSRAIESRYSGATAEALSAEMQPRVGTWRADPSFLCVRLKPAWARGVQVLFPPLTYLQPTGDVETVVVEGLAYEVVDVRPRI